MLMRKIDFNSETPYFVNGEFKWYLDDPITGYLKNRQAHNLPSIKNMACFIVIGNKVEDYVLINDNQNVISAYPYTQKGFEQMIAKINIIKISKHFR